jgi:hypothetical protein
LHYVVTSKELSKREHYYRKSNNQSSFKTMRFVAVCTLWFAPGRGECDQAVELTKSFVVENPSNEPEWMNLLIRMDV